VRICICDDQRLLAEALTALFEREGHHVVAHVEDPGGADEAVAASGADLCVVDLSARSDAPEAHAALGRLSSRVPVVAITEEGDGAGRRAVDAGATAALPRSRSGDDLVRLVERVDAGHRHPVAAPTPAPRGRPDLLLFLTSREVDVLQGLVDGASTAGLARRLDVRPATVRAHLQSLFAKLGVHSRIEAVAFALEKGLVPLRVEAGTRRPSPVRPRDRRAGDRAPGAVTAAAR
jgi:two-component system, NarL family, nitrate/nitrite response regulator NarL